MYWKPLPFILLHCFALNKTFLFLGFFFIIILIYKQNKFTNWKSLKRLIWLSCQFTQLCGPVVYQRKEILPENYMYVEIWDCCWTQQVPTLNYYMACVCSWYNTSCDWPIVRHYSPHGPITGLQTQSKEPYNKQLINLERLVFTGKSQASALPRSQYGYVSVQDFPVKTSLSVNKWLWNCNITNWFQISSSNENCRSFPSVIN